MKKQISMADLIAWTYGVQKAHTAVDQGRGLLPDERRADGRPVRMVSGCGVARCMETGILGVDIDYFGPDQGSLHPDAEEVHELVRQAVDLRMMDYIQVGQIIHYGQTGVTPDWMPGMVPIIEGVFDGKGRPVMMYPNHEDRKRRRNAYACELKIIRSQDDIDLARDVYVKWYQAMERLKIYYQVNALKLKDYQVIDVGVVAQPWKKIVDMCKRI